MHSRIRAAAQPDLDAINAIYNHYVLHSTCTWQEEPSTAAERIEWWRERAERYPVLAAEIEGEVVGFAALGPFRSRSGYRFTAESSVYLSAERRGQGIGRRLMEALLDAGREAGFHTVVAGICTEHAESMRLHAALGFVECGRLKEAGYKFGRWLDSVTMQKML
jgi:L-amino acid N-acyltransferase YncA